MILKKTYVRRKVLIIPLYEAQNRHNFKKTQRAEGTVSSTNGAGTVDNHSQENNCTPTSDQRWKPAKMLRVGQKPKSES